MNCLWILVLLCCCNHNGRQEWGCNTCGRQECDCNCNTCDRPVIMPRANERRGYDCDYPSAPFAPERDCECREREKERERERGCECRATEMEPQQEV